MWHANRRRTANGPENERDIAVRTRWRTANGPENERDIAVRTRRRTANGPENERDIAVRARSHAASDPDYEAHAGAQPTSANSDGSCVCPEKHVQKPAHTFGPPPQPLPGSWDCGLGPGPGAQARGRWPGSGARNARPRAHGPGVADGIPGGFRDAGGRSGAERRIGLASQLVPEQLRS